MSKNTMLLCIALLLAVSACGKTIDAEQTTPPVATTSATPAANTTQTNTVQVNTIPTTVNASTANTTNVSRNTTNTTTNTSPPPTTQPPKQRPLGQLTPADIDSTETNDYDVLSEEDVDE